MMHLIGPTDGTKVQSDNNNSSADKVENNENNSQHQITHNYATAACAVFGMCSIYD